MLRSRPGSWQGVISGRCSQSVVFSPVTCWSKATLWTAGCSGRRLASVRQWETTRAPRLGRRQALVPRNPSSFCFFFIALDVYGVDVRRNDIPRTRNPGERSYPPWWYRIYPGSLPSEATFLPRLRSMDLQPVTGFTITRRGRSGLGCGAGGKISW